MSSTQGDANAYYRRLHPSSNIILPTGRNDPERFPGSLLGTALISADRDTAGGFSASSTPKPWYPYDPHFKQEKLSDENVRCLEGAEMYVMKCLGVVPPAIEPVFLSEEQVKAAGLYKLCELCHASTKEFIRNVNARWPEQDQGMSEEKQVSVKHHGSLQLLRASADAGCHLCSILSFERYGQDELSLYDMRLTPNQIILKSQHGVFTKVWLAPDYYRPILSTIYTCGTTDAPTVLKQVKQWLHSCIADHETCNSHALLSSSDATTLHEAELQKNTPFRLIEIRSINGEVEGIRLITLSTVDETTKYLTLSHCWGGVDAIKLTERLLPQFSANIPMTDLPRTFSEAISITAHLGFKYLWIDSLCIIQDSPQDWQSQAQQMGRIYQCSVCTIAALKSTGPHGGLFAKRSLLPMARCRIAKDGGNAAHNEPVFTRQRYCAPKPLHSRAWVVQERHLSRRTINFGADMVSWNCVTAQATEEWPYFDQRVHHDPARQFHEILQDNNSTERIVEGHWIERWWSLVEEYTGKCLSYESDRFPAIEGMARIIQEKKQISMVHGLWHPFLINELLWCFDMAWNEPTVVKSEQQMKSPSWTWISTNRSVRHYNLRNSTYRISANVKHEIEMPHWVPRLPFHMINGDKGHVLRVFAPLLPIQHTPAHAGRERLSGRQIQIYPFRLCDGRKFPSEQEEQYWDGHWKPDLTPDPEWELYAVQLLQRAYRNDHIISMGLILICLVQENNLFQRVGMYEMEWGHRPEGWRGHIGMDLGYKVATEWETRDGRRWFGENESIWLQ